MDGLHQRKDEKFAADEDTLTGKSKCLFFFIGGVFVLFALITMLVAFILAGKFGHKQIIITGIGSLASLPPFILLGFLTYKQKIGKTYMYLLLLMMVPILFSGINVFTSIKIHPADDFKTCKDGEIWQSQAGQCVSCGINNCLSYHKFKSGDDPCGNTKTSSCLINNEITNQKICTDLNNTNRTACKCDISKYSGSPTYSDICVPCQAPSDSGYADFWVQVDLCHWGNISPCTKMTCEGDSDNCFAKSYYDGTCQCGTNPRCTTSPNTTCMNGQCVDPCANVTCKGSSDTCMNGTCYCGSKAVCAVNSDTCVSGTCYCGSNPACPDYTPCVSGKCQESTPPMDNEDDDDERERIRVGSLKSHIHKEIRLTSHEASKPVR